MRISNSITSLPTILLLAQQATAAFIPNLLRNLDILHPLEKRCTNPCGYSGQLCCASNQYCYTNELGQAACGALQGNAAAGTWQYMTTTYVQTDLRTVTATYSSFIAGVTQAPAGTQCSYSLYQTPCGSTCCNAGYYCKVDNGYSMCAQVPGGSSGYYSNIYTVTTVVTNTAGAPLRPTTQTILTLSSTAITGTTAFQTPVSTGAVIGAAASSSGGLNGGAIAGIVIGVIIGIILLILICACCCFKGLIDGLLAIFGLGPRRRRVHETNIVEERHRRTGRGRLWFGQRPARSEVVEEKKESGFSRGLGVAAFLGATAALLGLKRRHDRRDDKGSSSYGSYYSYSDYTSDSSPSSVTRTSRRSRSRR